MAMRPRESAGASNRTGHIRRTGEAVEGSRKSESIPESDRRQYFVGFPCASLNGNAMFGISALTVW